MDELKESVTITVDDEKPAEDSVIDLDISLNTQESLEASYITSEVINGELKAFIISSDKIVGIDILTDKGISLYSKVDFYGTYYLPVKITAVSKSGNQFNMVASSFYLNDAIVFRITGQKNSMVNITMRYTDG